MNYIPKQIAKKFIKDFHRGITQRYNKVIALILKLQEEYICLIIAPVIPTVFMRSVHQPRVYAFGALTTRLRVWCTPEALTNQGGGRISI